MKYILYNESFETQGSFATLQELRKFLCEKKYDEDYQDSRDSLIYIFAEHGSEL